MTTNTQSVLILGVWRRWKKWCGATIVRLVHPNTSSHPSVTTFLIQARHHILKRKYTQREGSWSADSGARVDQS